MRNINLPIVILGILFAIAAGQALPPENFVGRPSQLIALADGKIALATEDGVYIADDETFTRWTAVVSIPEDRSFQGILGGDSKFLHLVFAESGLGSNRRLATWKPDEGLKLSNLVVDLQCSFFDADVGAYAKAESLVITRNGGRAWLIAQQLFDRPRQIRQFIWVSSTSILATSESEIALFTLEKDNSIKRVWIVNVGATPLFVGVDAKTEIVWAVLGFQAVQARELKSGKVIGQDVLSRSISDLGVFKGRAYVASGAEGRLVDVYSVVDGSMAKVGRSNEWGGSDMFVAGADTSICLSGDPGILTSFSTDTLETKPLKVTANNSVIQRAKAAAVVAAATRNADLASPEELAAMVELSKKLSPAVASKVLDPINAKVGLTNKEKVQQMTAALQGAIERGETVDSQPARPEVVTNVEFGEMMTLLKLISEAEREQLSAAIMAKSGLSNREQVRQMTSGIKELLAKKQTTRPSTNRP